MMRYKKNVNEGAHIAGGAGGDSSCFLPALAAVAQKKNSS